MPTVPAEAHRMLRTALLAGIAVAGVLVMGCGDAENDEANAGGPSVERSASRHLDGVTKIGGGRGLYVRCTGSGSPTVVMEGGDGDTSDSYAFAEPAPAKVTARASTTAPTLDGAIPLRVRAACGSSSATSNGC